MDFQFLPGSWGGTMFFFKAYPEKNSNHHHHHHHQQQQQQQQQHFFRRFLDIPRLFPERFQLFQLLTDSLKKKLTKRQWWVTLDIHHLKGHQKRVPMSYNPRKLQHTLRAHPNQSPLENYERNPPNASHKWGELTPIYPFTGPYNSTYTWINSAHPATT